MKFSSSLKENKKLSPYPIFQPSFDDHDRFVYPPNIFLCTLDIAKTTVGPLLSHLAWKTFDLNESTLAWYRS
jgi:hypothetical protein